MDDQVVARLQGGGGMGIEDRRIQVPTFDVGGQLGTPKSKARTGGERTQPAGGRSVVPTRDLNPTPPCVDTVVVRPNGAGSVHAPVRDSTSPRWVVA